MKQKASASESKKPCLDEDMSFGNLSFDQSNEDDGHNKDLNIENELNKHFGLLRTPTGSTGSTSTTDTGSTGTTSSATTGAGTPTTASTGSNYEKIPLDPNIVFDLWGYRCISNKVHENKERKPTFKKATVFVFLPT